MIAVLADPNGALNRTKDGFLKTADRSGFKTYGTNDC
jgi:hypothetical protein